jgi:Right handed beta helix region
MATAARGGRSRPATYYIDAVRGTDSNAGTSPAAPWRTLGRVNRGRYIGGDAILLHGGERFVGTLRLSPADLRGTSRRSPLVVGSYGAVRAILAPRGASGVVATNVSGIHISGIDVVGDGPNCRRARDGIFLGARGLHGTLAAGISIDHVDVTGFCDGIVIGSADDASKIDHVRISDVAAHDNGDTGITTYDPARKHHDIRDVSITRATAYRNDDQGGIVLFGVERGVVEHSVAFGNGRGHAGDVGIWTFDSDRIVIAYNESYGNMTTGDDGDGFDLDGGVTNSRVEHNYAHDNQGIGFLICACVGYWYPQYNNVVAHNVSVGDGSSGQTSAIYVGGGSPFHNVGVYSNRAYSQTGSGPLVSVDGADAPFANVLVHDNLLVAGGRKTLLYADPMDAKRLSFARDHWVNCSGAFEVTWGSRRFMTLTGWRRATGQEPGGSDRGNTNLCSPAWWRASASSLQMRTS